MIPGMWRTTVRPRLERGSRESEDECDVSIDSEHTITKHAQS